MIQTYILEVDIAKYFTHTNNGKVVGIKPPVSILVDNYWTHLITCQVVSFAEY
jgi:hypothetical protein